MIDLSSWPEGSRLILRKERPHPGAQLRFRTRPHARGTRPRTRVSRQPSPSGPAAVDRSRCRCRDRRPVVRVRRAVSAMSSTVMWSMAVFDPALPASSSPASASPPATSGRSSTRHVVGIEATGPNRSSRSPSTLMPRIASAPSATATARSVNTRPGAWTHGPRLSQVQVSQAGRALSRSSASCQPDPHETPRLRCPFLSRRNAAVAVHGHGRRGI